MHPKAQPTVRIAEAQSSLISSKISEALTFIWLQDFCFLVAWWLKWNLKITYSYSVAWVILLHCEVHNSVCLYIYIYLYKPWPFMHIFIVFGWNWKYFQYDQAMYLKCLKMLSQCAVFVLYSNNHSRFTGDQSGVHNIISEADWAKQNWII